MTADAYPLQWPAGWPRTRRPGPSRFDVTFTAARDGLLREIRLLGGTHMVLSTNIPVRQDGLPYANRAQPDDRGVAVYFMRDGKQQCIPCDSWNKVEDNLQAIRKTIEALRGLERWGAKTIVDAAFSGFKELPSTSDEVNLLNTADEAAFFLSDFSDYGAYEILKDSAIRKKAYRQAASQLHPDSGGTKELFQQLQEAMKLLNGEAT